jgi:hypothetical protein
MRHRGENDSQSPSRAKQAEDDEVGSLDTLTALMATQNLLPGRHRAPVTGLQIPAQMVPEHDSDPTRHDIATTEATAAAPVVPVADAAPEPSAPTLPAVEIPHSAQWRASHLPRVIAGSLLAMAVLGTAGLGLRYAQSRAGDDLASLVVGFAVVVALWAVLIASTPQKVTLVGSVLTVHNTRGEERFDLVDALQPVDLVGDPRTSHWAVLLHRANNTTVVLRRNEVVASELDPIVRFYREIAHRRHAERDARFSL